MMDPQKFADRIAATLVKGRTLAESMMVDSCVIERKAASTWDDEAGVYTDAWTTIYDGKCRVQNNSNQVRNPMTGERERSVDDSSVHVPMLATGFEVGDRITVTASATDADLIGCVFWVSSGFHKTDATARRLPVSEIQQ